MKKITNILKRALRKSANNLIKEDGTIHNNDIFISDGN